MNTPFAIVTDASVPNGIPLRSVVDIRDNCRVARSNELRSIFKVKIDCKQKKKGKGKGNKQTNNEATTIIIPAPFPTIPEERKGTSIFS
jgi:hypothetical protein